MESKNQNEKGYWKACLTMLPIVLVAGIVPLLVHQVTFKTEMVKYAWYSNVNEYAEFFLAIKSIALSVLMVVMAVLIGIRIWKEKKKVPFVKLLIPLLVYWGMALISSIASVNRRYSFLGGFEHFESILVISCYVIIVYYIFLYAQTKEELRVVVDAICFSSTIIGLIGTLQGVGIDYLKSPLVQKLISSRKFLESMGGELQLNFGDGQAYATLYNPNYLGVYGSFLVPFITILILFDKSKWRKVWHCLNFVLVLAAMFSSRSRAGLISVAIALAVAAVLCFRPVIKHWYLTIPALNLVIVILLLANSFSNNKIFGRLQKSFAKESGKTVEVTAVDGTVVKKTGLTELYTSKNGVIFKYNEMRAQVSVYVGEGLFGFYALNEYGEQIELVGNEDGTEFKFTTPALYDLTIVPQVFMQPVGDSYEECLGFELHAGSSWDFVYNHFKDEYKYITVYGKASDMIMAEAKGFQEHQYLFSSRGYIWSHTIPLLKKHIILGSGPDTFLFEFPQNDYLKMYDHGYKHSIMTKPHNMYLQIAVQTGLISLIAFLAFYIWYLVQSIRIYFMRPVKTSAEGFGIAALIGSIGYVISGLTNDSMVVTAPIFWVMLGIGVTVNSLVKNRREETAAESETENTEEPKKEPEA